MSESTFSEWALLELFGHRRLAGLVSEATIGGATFIRIDVPGGESESEALDGPDTIASQFYSPSAVYSITPTTEAIARAFAARNQPTPVSRWELTPARDGDAEVDAEYGEPQW